VGGGVSHREGSRKCAEGVGGGVGVGGYPTHVVVVSSLILLVSLSLCFLSLCRSF
jgi:hypothetical protein